MPASKLDAVYRSILTSKFFTKGWGKPENLQRLFEFRKVVSNREECFKLIDRNYPVTITKEQNFTDCKILEGYFMTPLEQYLPGIVPEVAQKAHFQVVLPAHWLDSNCKPVCLHLAGTGDHFFWRRRNLMVKPLMKEAKIGGIILENPFYGLRKPIDQVRSSLRNVSDIFVMGGCLILESLVLFHWCERNGFGPLGVTGLSMGGHMASLAATNWPKPLVLVPCLSWSTASAVFLQGVMSQSINWDLLEDQYLSDGVYREKLSKMVTIVDEAFLAGKKFARSYPHSMKKIELTNQKRSVPHAKNIDVTCNDISDVENDAKNIDIVGKNIDKEALEQSNIESDLKRLLKENKISQTLYNKLTSNEKFELDINDINDINNLNQENITELLLKYRIGENKKPLPVHTNLETLKIMNDIPQMISNEKKGENIKETNSWTDIMDFWNNLPFLKPKSGKKIDISKIHWRDREALQFMRGIMDECTHLSNFSIPYDTSLIIAVCAKRDAYVPREDVGTLEEIWPGAEVRYVDAGHVSAYILHQSLFRACIKEAFERSKKKWKDGKHIE